LASYHQKVLDFYASIGEYSDVARKLSRWQRQSEGRAHGSLSRATGTPRGSRVPSRLMKAARKGKFGRATQKRAQKARGSGAR